jgi:hypothetical protein
MEDNMTHPASPARALIAFSLLMTFSLLLGLGFSPARPPLTHPQSSPSTSTQPGPPPAIDLAYVVANAGLADANIQYLTLGSGLLTFFEQNRLLIDLLSEDNDRERVTISFLDASPSARLEALDPLPGKLNIFKGSDPQGWKTNLERFAGLRYQELYPGVDLVYQPGRAALKGTFTLQPGADPDQIRWRYEGVAGLALEAESGDLLLRLDSRPPGRK